MLHHSHQNHSALTHTVTLSLRRTKGKEKHKKIFFFLTCHYVIIIIIIDVHPSLNQEKRNHPN